MGKPNVLISTKIARDYPNSDGTPKKVGDTLLIGGKPFQIIGIYETGSFLIDTTIVMEITTARQLLNVDKTYVSVFYVEPEPLTDLERPERPDHASHRRRAGPEHVAVQPPGGQHHGQARPVPALDGGSGSAGRRRGYRQHDADERHGAVRRIRRHAGQRLDPAEHPGPGDGGKRTAGPAFRRGRPAFVAFAGVDDPQLLLTQFELKLELTALLVAASNVTAIVIATLAGLYPAWRASRMTPMDAIRNEAS